MKGDITENASHHAVSLAPQQATLACLYVLAACDGVPSSEELALIDALAASAASLADMAMNLQATGLGVDELVDTLETELAE